MITIPDNDWILYRDYCGGRFPLLNQGNVKQQFMHDGEIVKGRKNGGHIITQAHIDNDIAYHTPRGEPRQYADSDLNNVMVYDDVTDDWIRFSGDNYFIRMDPKQYSRLVEIASILQVGDFIQCSGSKGRYAWRKVLEIRGNVVFGQCASQPNDESLAFHSSDNGILTVKTIYRDGEQLY